MTEFTFTITLQTSDKLMSSQLACFLCNVVILHSLAYQVREVRDLILSLKEPFDDLLYDDCIIVKGVLWAFQFQFIPFSGSCTPVLSSKLSASFLIFIINSPFVFFDTT